MEGMKALENFIDEKLMELEVKDAAVLSDCAPGQLCAPEDFFEMVSMCRLCGKLC